MSLRAAPTAEELALAARGGSVAAFEALVERFQEPLFNFLRVRTGNEPDAEELTQEAFLRAWQHLDRYDPRWRFSTWLYTLGKRLAVGRFRAAGRRPRSGGDEPPETASSDPDPAEAAIRDEERSNLWSAASSVLRADQRSALWLRYAEGLSIQETARILGKREVTVRVLLFRARSHLAKHLGTTKMEARDATAPRGRRADPHVAEPATEGRR